MKLYRVTSCGEGCGWYYPYNSASRMRLRCPRCGAWTCFAESSDASDLVDWCREHRIPFAEITRERI